MKLIIYHESVDQPGGSTVLEQANLSTAYS